jgi:hypothetical protein
VIGVGGGRWAIARAEEEMMEKTFGPGITLDSRKFGFHTSLWPGDRWIAVPT